ncbi:MAG TPA: TIGR04372 family glycosyltransferase [Pseudomonadales bacterium]|nr:TIGR04372 family glycosyltransferase [Pseudomonadales bacterium]
MSGAYGLKLLVAPRSLSVSSHMKAKKLMILFQKKAADRGSHKKTYVLTPHPYAIGNRVEEIFFALLMAQRKQLKLLLLEHLDIPLLHAYKLTNRASMSLVSEYFARPSKVVIISCAVILSLVYLPTRIISRVLFHWKGRRLFESYNFPRIGIDPLWIDNPATTRTVFSWDKVEAMNWGQQLANYRCPTLQPSVEQSCRAKLAQMGLGPEDWFACLHVREGGFKSDFGRRDYRNANIENCISGIEEITRRGGWVIRIGDESMKALPDMDRVIDYPFSAYKSDEMDLFLVAHCRLYIGTISGPMELAILFSRQMLILNMYDWSCGVLIRETDRGLLQHVYSKDKQRYLSLEESAEAGRDLLYTFGSASSRYELQENSPEEIRKAVEESLSLMKDPHIPQSSLQQMARERIKSSARKIIAQDQFHPTASKSEEVLRFQYKTAARVSMEGGAICQFSLEANWKSDRLNRD